MPGEEINDLFWKEETRQMQHPIAETGVLPSKVIWYLNIVEAGQTLVFTFFCFFLEKDNKLPTSVLTSAAESS